MVWDQAFHDWPGYGAPDQDSKEIAAPFHGTRGAGCAAIIGASVVIAERHKICGVA
jgi:hypothetical protein